MCPCINQSRHWLCAVPLDHLKGLFNDEQKFEIFERGMDGTPFSKAEEVQPD
jgi:hypothetical protein